VRQEINCLAWGWKKHYKTKNAIKIKKKDKRGKGRGEEGVELQEVRGWGKKDRSEYRKLREEWTTTN